MKKLLGVAVITLLLEACNNGSTANVSSDSSKVTNTGLDTTVKLDTTHVIVSSTADQGI